MSKYNFKYIVIGSGPAGSTVALSLAKAKKNVALVEGRFYGGANLNTRDIPYGVALDFAHHFSRLSSYPELKNQDISFNLPTIPARILSTVIKSGGNEKKPFEEAGVVCLSGYAHIIDRHTVAINQKQFTAETIIIATGSHLKTSNISGVDSVNYLTPENAIRITKKPKVVAVIGAGSAGCEIAEYYAELGIEVILIETASRILPHEDTEVSEALSEYFIRKLGVNILTESNVVALQQDDFSKCIIFQNNNSEKMVRVDCIVLATGSEPSLSFGLENANVKYQESGIIVNKFFQTSTKNIYAIGDCIGRDSSTDRAIQDGTTLANNLIGGNKSTVNYKGLIRVINTQPEIAIIGNTESELIQLKRKYKKSITPLSEITASKIHSFNHGFVKLLIDRNYHIIGASIVAPNASLMAEEISLAMRHNLTILEIASTPHIANSYNEAIKLTAKKLLAKKIAKLKN